MKKRIRFVALFLAGCVAVGILIGVSFRGYTTDNARRQLDIAVVVYGSSESWTSLELGIRQACETLGIVPPVLVVADGDDAADQLALLQREIQNGAEGLLVAVSDSALLAETLEAYAARIPVVAVETGAGNLPVAQADNYAAGAEMAARLHGQNPVLLEYNLQRESVAARFMGFTESFEGTYTTLAVGGKEDLEAALTAHLAQNPTATLITLDNFATETAVDAAAELAGVTIYGFGGTEKIVNALDRGVIRQLCFENEFNTGYLGMCRLAALLGLDAPEGAQSVGYLFVDGTTMYEPEIERLLFPIIQ